MVQNMSTVVYMSTESIKYCILAVDIDTVHDYCIAREYRIWVLHMFSTYVFALMSSNQNRGPKFFLPAERLMHCPLYVLEDFIITQWRKVACLNGED
jgi:hypothetical protein